MADVWVNPYSGQEEESCSVSFGAQQQVFGSTGSPQTEAEYNKSKQLGEWGVIKAKLANGEIPSGTKVLTYQNKYGSSRGYVFVKNGQLLKKTFGKDDKAIAEGATTAESAESMIKGGVFDTAIPQATAAKPKAEPVAFTHADAKKVGGDPLNYAKDGQPLAVNLAGDYVSYDPVTDLFSLYSKVSYGYTKEQESSSLASLTVDSGQDWFKPDKSAAAGTPKTTSPPAPTSQVAAPVAKPAVPTSSTSVGSMSNEDVSAMFVKIKDDLAKEKGVNVKGANADLDELVYEAIGSKTGYTAAEVQAKITAYKATGAKLSALKKKVMSGKYKVPEGKPQQTKASPSAPLNTAVHTSKPVSDPKPNGVPTTATPKLTNEVKEAVKTKVQADPKKVYTDEDIAAQYIMRKDEIVASNTNGWTLYTKNDDFDAAVYAAITDKTGFDTLAAKQAIANYLGSGKKLSVLKKQLIKQGAFTKKADTLKSGGPSKATTAEKEAEVAAKAAAGYTPTSTPATGTPKVDTGKPAPKKVVAADQENGDISQFSDKQKANVFEQFKKFGSNTYLSSGPAANYQAFLDLKTKYAELGVTKYTMLHFIRIIDEEGAKKAGVPNGNLFEKQVVSWMTSPAGTSHIRKAEQAAAAKLEVEKAAKLLQASQPALPADSALYQAWSLDKAHDVSQTWLDAQPWTDRQKRDLRYYTGSAYREMNEHLRLGQSIDERGRNAIEGARSGMRPTTEPIMVQRGTGLSQFSNLGIGPGDKSLVWGLTGKVMRDEGFLSTSAGGRAAFGGEVKLEIECPVGTPMAYVAPISNFPGENEMLLQAGMEYQILQVRQDGGQLIIRMRVVNWPGKVK